MISVLSSAARMATHASASAQDKNDERRRRVMLGPLPTGFLEPENQTMSSQEQQEAADRQTALALQRQLCEGQGQPRPQLTGRLSITLAQAKLVKNYGMTRMDPYVRLRVGHCIYETHTDPNGGKNPRWNKVIHCLLPPGVNSIYLEIFDECSFTMDELIAWAHITIPPAVVQGETHEDWYPLNGKQGDGMEGMINLVLSYSLAPAAPLSYAGIPGAYPPVLMVPNAGVGFTPMTVYPAPQSAVPVTQGQPGVQRPPSPAQAAVPTPQITLSEDEIKLIEEMFPSIEKEVIKSVIEANRGNKDGTINSLLQMSE